MAVFVFSFSSRADLGGWVTELTIFWTFYIPDSVLIKAVQGHWLCGTGKWCPVCVVSLKAFFSWIEFGKCTGIGLLFSPPCPGQLAHGSRVWQICFGLGAYQQSPPSLEILSFTWTAFERVELFVQRMRRTGKKEEVNKCSSEHICRTPSLGMAGMTEMTRAASLSRGADKRQRARASPWNCTGETSPGSPLLPSVGWLAERWVLARHIITLYFQGQSCPMSPVAWERCMHIGGQSVHPKAPSFHYCQVEETKIGFALWRQDAAQRMCIYFSKLCELTQQTVPAWEENIVTSFQQNFISTKNPSSIMQRS